MNKIEKIKMETVNEKIKEINQTLLDYSVSFDDREMIEKMIYEIGIEFYSKAQSDANDFWNRKLETLREV